MNKKKLKRYRLKINPEKGSTVDFISQVENPAIEVGFLKFNSEELKIRPGSSENEQEWVSRCIPFHIKEGYEQEQAAAICYSMWERRNETAAEGNMDIFGYSTRYFHMCPGAQATFNNLVQKATGEDTIGMIRSAAQVADNVFRIEEEVINSGTATQKQMDEAILLVDDFEDIIQEIDKLIGESTDISYMYGHIETISTYLSKESLKDFVDACWEGYEPVGFKIKDGKRVPNCVPVEKQEKMQSYTDYPKAAMENAARGIRLNKEIGNKCATQVGKVRAQQIADGEPLSKETITRTYSYLSRAKAYYNANDSKACGTISYLLWGGDEMLRWAESKMNNEDFVKAKMQSENNDDKMELFGPVLIPDLPIYRHSERMGEYEIIFKAEDIKEIAMNFMKSGYQNNVNLDHGNKMADSYVFESFVSSEMMPNPKPYEDLPLGTWFVRMKVEDPKVWQAIKEGKRNGFSIEGIFEYMVEEFEKTFKPEKQTTNILSEQEKLNLEKMIKDLFKKIFNELSQELGENAEGLSEWQRVASSDYKIEAREVGQKVEIVDAMGNLIPAPDGSYEFEDGFKFMVKDGMISAIDGTEEKMPGEEPMQEEAGMMPKKKQYMDMLADYPWDECIMDMTEDGYTEEQAQRICGSIKWKNMEAQEEAPKAESAELEELRKEIEELKSSMPSKTDLEQQLNEIKEEFKSVFEKFSKVPAEPSKVSKSPIAKDIERQKFEQFINTIRNNKK